MDTPNTDVIQGTLDMLVLKTLSLEPMHGYGIARRVEQISRGVFKVNAGSLLTALERLVRAGWLDAEWRQTENSRRAKFYRLTPPARSNCRRKRRTGRDEPRRSRDCSTRRAKQCLSGANSLAEPASSRADDRPTRTFQTKCSTTSIKSLPRSSRADSTRARRGAPRNSRSETRRSRVSACAPTGGRTRSASCSAICVLPSRRLRSNPGFAVVSALTLALGIGASTAIFSAVNPILFEPLPYPRSNQIATLSDVASDGTRLAMTFGTYREIVARSRSFSATAVSRVWQPTLTGPSEPERFTGQRVSAGYFATLGVTPALGRDFDAAEDRPGGDMVALISDGVWRRRFGADAAIIGRRVMLDGDQYVIIGVMPANFEDVPGTSSELWTTLRYASVLPSEGPEWGHNLRTIARLREGVSLDQARRELATIARQPVAEFARPPWAAMRQPLAARLLHDDVTRGVKPALVAVLGAALLVLLIACVNVTNLLIARGAQRRGEFAMRAALGAGRSRLVRQMLTESLLLAAIGGALGVAIAELGVRVLIDLAPPELPRVGAIGVNAAALVFALAMSVAIGLAVGVWPAVHASRNDLHASLQQGSRRTAGGRNVGARLARRRRSGARAGVVGERRPVAAELDAALRGRSGIRAVAIADDASADVRRKVHGR